MNCSEAEHFFDAYLDGELAGSLRLEFDAHRLRCVVCQQKLAMMEACEHILARDARGPALSDDFADRVMDEVSQRRVIALSSRKRRIMVGAAVALQAAAVIVFAILWIGYWSKPAPPVLEPGANPEFTAAVGKALTTGNRDRLEKLVDARYEQYLAARSNLEEEVSALAGYFPSLFWIFGERAPSTDEPLNPLNVFLPGFSPPTADEVEPTPDATSTYSL